MLGVVDPWIGVRTFYIGTACVSWKHSLCMASSPSMICKISFRL